MDALMTARRAGAVLACATLMTAAAADPQPVMRVAARTFPACVMQADMDRLEALMRSDDTEAGLELLRERGLLKLCVVVEAGARFEVVGLGRAPYVQVRPAGGYRVYLTPMRMIGGAAKAQLDAKPQQSPGIAERPKSAERGIQAAYPTPPERQLLDVTRPEARAVLDVILHRPCVHGGTISECVATAIDSPDIHRPDWTVASTPSGLLVERLGRIRSASVRYAWEVRDDGTVRAVTHHATGLEVR